MTKPSMFKRKRLYLINRDFQLRYTRLAVLVGLASTVMTLFLILFPLVQFRIIRFPNFVPVPFLWAIGFAALLNFGIVAFMGILVTHRIAGPMYALVRHIRVIQTGRLTPPLQVRTGDELKYVVRNFNDMLAYLARVTQSDQATLDAIAMRLRQPGGAAEALALATTLSDELGSRLVGRSPSDRVVEMDERVDPE